MIALALALVPGVAAAQDAPTQDDQAITVEAERDRAKAARELAKDLTRSLKIRTPLERFTDPICPFVVGAEPQTAFAIESRIKANAREAGLPVGGKKCQKNMLIGFVENAEQEIATLLSKKRRSFGYLTSFERKRLQREDGPTRAWHVVIAGDENGERLQTADDGTPINRSNDASRIGFPYTRLIESSVVLIEQSAVNGKTLEQIADFATMRGLMPVVEASEGAHNIDTILSLFDPDSETPELTSFDRDYLKAYYSRRNQTKSGLATMFDVGKRYARPGDDPED